MKLLKDDLSSFVYKHIVHSIYLKNIKYSNIFIIIWNFIVSHASVRFLRLDISK